MQKAAAKWLMVASVIIGLSASGLAQDLDAGKAEYLSSCSTCHGSDGKGNGPLGSRLRTKPPDLTIFAKKNNGVFPVSAVYEAID
jgi:mono/diheme cytochrome c family protein